MFIYYDNLPDGWRLGSLCEIAKGDWYACLIDDEGMVHKATGETPEEAISRAKDAPDSGRLFIATIPPSRSLASILGIVKEKEIRRA